MNTVDSNVLRDIGLLQDNNIKGNEDQNQLNQSSFLTLMTTQLMNQNPTEPMDNGDFLGQMAQFSTVSGIQDLNGSIKSLLDNSVQSQILQASSIVGKEVLVKSEPFVNDNADTIEGMVGLDTSAERLEVQVFNASNAVIRTIPITNSSTGQHSFAWDGLDDSGNAAPAGTYRFAAEVTRNDDVSTTPVFVFDKVDSVQFNSDYKISLSLAHQGNIDFDQISQIK